MTSTKKQQHPEWLYSKLQQAAILHNMALLHKKKSKQQEQCWKSMDCYKKALSLYLECHAAYHGSVEQAHKNNKENEDVNHHTNSNNNHNDHQDSSDDHGQHNTDRPVPLQIYLELKIAQTHQSMAKLYMKLGQDQNAIEAHEDVISFLLEEQQWLHQRQELMQRLTDIGVQEPKCVSSSPTSVTATSSDNVCFSGLKSRNTYSGGSSPTGSSTIGSSRRNNSDVPCWSGDCSLVVDSENGSALLQILPLTLHERTRIISSSLNALANVYFLQETCLDGQAHDETCTNHTSKQPSQRERGEDALRYYEESLQLLQSMDPPMAPTRVAALSNCSVDTEKCEMNDCSKDQCPRVLYRIDLRKDMIATLWAMAHVHRYRKQYRAQIHVLSQARDLIHLLLPLLPSSALRSCPSSSSSSSLSSSSWSSLRNQEEMVESELARAYVEVQDWGKAHMSYQHVLCLRRETFGEDSMEMAHVYRSLSTLNQKMGDLGQSLGWNKRAVRIYSKVYQDTASSSCSSRGLGVYLVASLQEQGSLYVEMREVERAIESYRWVAEKQMELLGRDETSGGEINENCATVCKTWNVLGDLYKSKGCWKEAKASYERALTLSSKYGSNQDVDGIFKSLSEMEKLEGEKGMRGLPSRQALSSHPIQTLSQEQNEKDEAPSPRETPLSSPNHLPFRPPVAPSTRKKIGLQALDGDWEQGDHEYCKIVETDPDFENCDDDAVSQITFLTSQLEPPSVADRSYSGQSYRTLEDRLENWSPAEYVFRAVDKIANVTEEFAQEFFSMSRYNSKRKAKKREDPNKQLKSKKLESVYEGNDVGELDCRDKTSTSENLFRKHAPSKSLDQLSDGKIFLRKPKSSVPSSANTAHDIDEMKQTECIDQFREYSSNTYHSEQDETSNIHTDNSVATSIFGSLLGTHFVNDGSVASTTQTSTLYGIEFIDNESSDQLRMKGDQSHKTKGSTSSSTLDMDEMLAQLNVISCDMEGDAMPFEDVLKNESKDDLKQIRAKNKRNKTFEKISICLGTLDKLVDEYGPDHDRVLEKMATLAGLYLDIGNIDKGILKYRQLLDLQIKKFGKHSAEVCETYAKLGRYYSKVEEFDKAIDSFTTAKEIDEYLHGSDNPRLAHHFNSLGSVALDRNRFAEAMDFFQSALHIQQMHLGPNEFNPDISLTYVNIGSVYRKEKNYSKKRSKRSIDNNLIDLDMLEKIAFAHSERGEYMKAIHFYNEILKYVKLKDDSAFKNSVTHSFLGELNIKVGRYQAAMDHYNVSLSLVQNSKSSSDLNLWKVKSDLAVVEYHLGNFKKAMTILESAYMHQRKYLGKHPNVAKTIYHLGVIQRLQYKFKSALSSFNIALKIQLSTIGKHHPDTIQTQVEISKLLMDRHNYRESLRHLESILRIQINILHHKHPDIASTLHNFGVCYSRMNDDTMAMKYFEQCYRMQLKVLNFDCPAVASTKDELGKIFTRQGKLDKAFQLFDDALRIRRKVSADHYETALSMYSMGQYYMTKCNYSDALVYFKDSMRVAIESFGPDHPFVGDIHVAIGNICMRQCHFDEAKSKFHAALVVYDTCDLPKSHRRVLECQESLKRVEHEENLCV